MDTMQLQIPRDISRWDEAIPMGNGEMGCLLFGNSRGLIFALDRGDIWDRTNSPEHTPGFNYANLVRLKQEGNKKEIHRIFEVPYHRPTPTKLPTGRLSMDLQINGAGTFSLDLKRAEAEFRVHDIFVKTYIHATQHVGMIYTNSKQPVFKTINPRFGRLRKWDQVFKKSGFSDKTTNKLRNVKYAMPKYGQEKQGAVQLDWFVQPLNDDTCYGIMLGHRPLAEGQEYAYYAYLAQSTEELIQIMKQRVLSALTAGYSQMQAAHLEWWNTYFNLSSVSLPDSYIENRYNIGNYLLGSASRKGNYPMPLQGLWTACDDKFLPPWKGDYHHDLNTQMTYYSYLKSNHLEQGEVFIDFLVSLTERAKEFARNCYNADGLCLPSLMDIDGYALGGWAMYSMSPTNQMWLCQVFERYYSYTGNMDFLKNTAYPYMESSAAFIRSLLQEDEDGYLVLPISSSPEIHDNTLKAFVKPNSNYDQAMLLYLFGALEKLAPILNKDPLPWTHVLKKLRPLAVNRDKVLRISTEEDLLESHRHQSHAMGIHPLRLLDYHKSEDKEIIDATINHAVKLGPKHYTGYSYTWLAEFFAIAKNGDKALEYLNIFWNYFCSVNTFHLNGDYKKQGYSSMSYRPFTLEGNFCALDALQEMLLYSEDGVIALFPALPTAWEDVSFQTLRAWGGVLVSASMKKSRLTSASFYAENDVVFKLRGAEAAWKYSGGTVTPYEDGVIVQLKQNTKLEICIK